MRVSDRPLYVSPSTPFHKDVCFMGDDCRSKLVFDPGFETALALS